MYITTFPIQLGVFIRREKKVQLKEKMTYTIPSYVLNLPNELTRYIGAFLTHPDTLTRQYRALTIAAKMLHDLENRIVEIARSPVQTAMYMQPDNRDRYKSMMQVHDLLKKYMKMPVVNIDTMMHLYKFHGMGWYSRDIQPFYFTKKRKREEEV